MASVKALRDGEEQGLECLGELRAVKGALAKELLIHPRSRFLFEGFHRAPLWPRGDGGAGKGGEGLRPLRRGAGKGEKGPQGVCPAAAGPPSPLHPGL